MNFYVNFLKMGRELVIWGFLNVWLGYLLKCIFSYLYSEHVTIITNVSITTYLLMLELIRYTGCTVLVLVEVISLSILWYTVNLLPQASSDFIFKISLYVVLIDASWFVNFKILTIVTCMYDKQVMFMNMFGFPKLQLKQLSFREFSSLAQECLYDACIQFLAGTVVRKLTQVQSPTLKLITSVIQVLKQPKENNQSNNKYANVILCQQQEQKNQQTYPSSSTKIFPLFQFPHEHAFCTCMYACMYASRYVHTYTHTCMEIS
eukprot:TRINITY_DN3582_c1_g1_i6.p1 TRINITY_DN3582_c1_g1~~TRINITY_DN3582_c1_g1_i6.p1  ORF type:complete len:262 (-),score=-3.69 TRINITY_DN3582_c1_g1_i6:893-1678(-)